MCGHRADIIARHDGSHTYRNPMPVLLPEEAAQVVTGKGAHVPRVRAELRVT